MVHRFVDDSVFNNCAQGCLMGGEMDVVNNYCCRTRKMSTKNKYCGFNTFCQQNSSSRVKSKI